MPKRLYLWTPKIIEHLAEHGVTPEEFEEVVGEPVNGQPHRVRLDNDGAVPLLDFQTLGR